MGKLAISRRRYKSAAVVVSAVVIFEKLKWLGEGSC